LTLRFASDENFDGRIVRGLFRAMPDLDAGGIITTVAGNGLLCDPPTVPQCGDGGPAVDAKLDQPQDVLLVPGGFLIADADETAGPTDTGENRIRIVAPRSVWRRISHE